MEQGPAQTAAPMRDSATETYGGYASAPAHLGYPHIDPYHARRSRSMYRLQDLPAEERLRKRNVMNFRSRGAGLKTVNHLLRFVSAALVFITIILNWVSSFAYESVVLGIVNLVLITLMVLSDIPGLYENVRFIRTSGISFSRTYVRMAAFLALITIMTPRGYFLNRLNTPVGLVISNTTFSIIAAAFVGFTALFHFASWLFYFRSHGNPDVHEIDFMTSRLSSSARLGQATGPVVQLVPAPVAGQNVPPPLAEAAIPVAQTEGSMAGAGVGAPEIAVTERPMQLVASPGMTVPMSPPGLAERV